VTNLDKLAEKMVRGVASRTSRRSLFGMLGTLLAGTASLPLLPVARADAPAKDTPVGSGNLQDPGDQTSCDYWRYCAIDGSLCSCYGGSVTACPPGLEMSPITWIGTCHNPADDRNYIISYNDCCGGVAQGRCACQRNEGDRPVVRPQNNNEITWCFGTKSQSYTCTVALILGVALDQK
jgi:methylamine dehydrogenase light chain